MDQDFKTKIDQACETAEVFTKLYYEIVDDRRNHMTRMYLDTATLIWNGNGIEGKEQIQKFWLELPPSKHTISTLDAQPITNPNIAEKLTFLIKVTGHVRYDEKTSRPFSQTFLIAAAGHKWKIVSDCFRTQEAPDVSS